MKLYYTQRSFRRVQLRLVSCIFRQLYLVHGREGHAQLGGPDLVGIMLDPARFGEILGEFFLGHAANFAVVVKQDAAVRGRSGVKRHNVLFHKALPLAGICDD